MKDFLLSFSAHLASLAAKDFWDQIGGVSALVGLLVTLIVFLAWLLKRGQRTTIVELNEKIELLTEDSKNLLAQKKQLTAELVQKTKLIFELERDSPSGVRALIARELSENNYIKVAQIAKSYIELNSEAIAESYFWLSRQKWREVLGFSETQDKLITHSTEEENSSIQLNIDEAVALAQIAAQIDRMQTVYSKWATEIIQIQALNQVTLLTDSVERAKFFEELRVLQHKNKSNAYASKVLKELFISMDKQGLYLAALYIALEAKFWAQHSSQGSDLEKWDADNNLAVVYLRLGRYEEAKQLLEVLLTNHQARSGQNHPDVLNTEHNISIADIGLGLYRNANQSLEYLLPRMQEVLGPNHLHTMLAENNLAVTYLEMGLNEQARLCFESMLTRQQAVLGLNHPETLNIESNLASAYLRLGRYKESKQLLESLIPRRQAALGINHPEVMKSENNLAAVNIELGLHAVAKHSLEGLLPKRRLVLGINHPFVLATENNIALACFGLGLHSEAKKQLETLLHRTKNDLGSEHPEVFIIKKNIALFSKKQR